MHATHLHEHDANQGAQSSGEFLGMTGNSGWYLLGSSGATILMVIVLWGALGVSLLLCLFVGFVLCVMSVAYVFLLKNNRPEHYDTDFFESALVEAGVMPFSFGPRRRRLVNPFTGSANADTGVPAVSVAPARRRSRPVASVGRARPSVRPTAAVAQPVWEETEAKTKETDDSGALAAQRSYEQLQEQLATTEEMLEEALAERGDD